MPEPENVAAQAVITQRERRANPAGTAPMPDPVSEERAVPVEPLRAALERLERFMDEWPPSGANKDYIYGLWVNKEDEPRVLLASDLRAVVGAAIAAPIGRTSEDPTDPDDAFALRVAAPAPLDAIDPERLAQAYAAHREKWHVRIARAPDGPCIDECIPYIADAYRDAKP